MVSIMDDIEHLKKIRDELKLLEKNIHLHEDEKSHNQWLTLVHTFKILKEKILVKSGFNGEYYNHEKDCINNPYYGWICPSCKNHHRHTNEEIDLMIEKRRKENPQDSFEGYHDCKNLILSNERNPETGLFDTIGQCCCYGEEHGERENNYHKYYKTELKKNE